MTTSTQAHDASEWELTYAERVGETYPLYCRKQYKSFLTEIRQHMYNMLNTKTSLFIREEGCGIGTITKILTQDAPSEVKFAAFDYSEGQVRNTKENLSQLDVEIYQGNHFEFQGHADIIHAHGVLEHFSDEEISKVLMRQRCEAEVVIHYVPLDKWGAVGSYGDERLLPIEHWVEHHNPSWYCTFNEGRDVVLIWF